MYLSINLSLIISLFHSLSLSLSLSLSFVAISLCSLLSESVLIYLSIYLSFKDKCEKTKTEIRARQFVSKCGLDQHTQHADYKYTYWKNQSK